MRMKRFKQGCDISREDVLNNLIVSGYKSVADVKDKIEANRPDLMTVKCWIKNGKIKRLMQALAREEVVKISKSSNVFSVKKVRVCVEEGVVD